MRIAHLTVVLVFILYATLSMPAMGQEGTAAETAASGIKYFDFFVVKGGWIAYVIIVLSVVALALTIEHCVSIRRTTIVPPEAVARVKAFIDEKKYVEAVQYSADEPSMLGYVLNAALTEAANGFAAMERGLEEALEERSAKLYRKIEYLNIIGNVSPMLGLFGTVVGMIYLFAEIHAADAFPPAQVVADQVAVALITTFWGLAVAIPSLSVYAIFRNRIDVLTAECAIAADRILAVFKPASTAAPSPAKPGIAREAHALRP